MKSKLLMFSLLAAITWIACEDDIDSIGLGIQPGGDRIVTFSAVVGVTGETIQSDSIYAKSVNGLLGRFTDPTFGDLKAGYACQFYPTRGFGIIDSIYLQQIDSVQLLIMFQTYVGDSLTPMEVTVYPLTKPLPKNYYAYTHAADAENLLKDYYDPNSILGKKSYSARDLNISDSLNLANLSTSYKVVSVNLPLSLGYQFLEEYKKPDQGAYQSPEALIDFFPGVYVSSSFGNGCILNVERTTLAFYYTRMATIAETDSNDVTTYRDTLYRATSTLDVTKEILQLNTYVGDNQTLLSNTGDDMYVKSPAGIFTKITIPITDIQDSIGTRKFSGVKLTLPVDTTNYYHWQYALSLPGSGKSITSTATAKMLLIDSDSVVPFFEEQRVADSQYAYSTTYNSSENAYIFSNIANVVQKAMDNHKTELVLRLIPVQVESSETSTYYGTVTSDYATAHYLYPSAVKLYRNDLKIEILAADRDD